MDCIDPAAEEEDALVIFLSGLGGSDLAVEWLTSAGLLHVDGCVGATGGQSDGGIINSQSLNRG